MFRRTSLAGLLLLAALAVAPTTPAQFRPGFRPLPVQDWASSAVDSWYRQYLRRPADPQASIWVEMLRSGQPQEQVLSHILGSDEYFRLAGNTPPAFVTQLFRDLAGRRPSDRELRLYLIRLARGSQPEEIAFDLLRRNPPAWGGAGPPVSPPNPTYPTNPFPPTFPSNPTPWRPGPGGW